MRRGCASRNAADGVFTKIGCRAQFSSKCGGAVSDGLNGARSVTVSPDNSSVYVATYDDDGVARFDRNTSTGVLTHQGCTKDVGSSPSYLCANAQGDPQTANGLAGAQGVAVSNDGASIYVAGYDDDAIVRFDRELQPVPANTALPSITGSPYVGQVLTCSQGTWTNSPTSYAYQWLRGGSAIAGATSSTYSLGAADAGGLISCAVTSTNAGGSTVSTSAAVTVPVLSSPVTDTTPPVTTIESGPVGAAREITATFVFSANEAGVGFECRVDTRPWGACSSPEIVYGLSVGKHTFYARAQDWAGNVGETASWSWKIDRRAPKVKDSNVKKKKKGKIPRIKKSALASFSGLVGDDYSNVKSVKIKLKIENPRKNYRKGKCASLSLIKGSRMVNKCTWGFARVKGTQRWKFDLSKKVQSKLRKKDHYTLLIRTLDTAGNHKINRAKFRVK